MPVQSSIKRLLPAEVRAELDRRLVTSEFSNYDGLISWLNESGYRISRSALGRHAAQFERKLEAVKRATDQAAAVVKASPDEAGALGDSLTRLLQTRIFDVLVQAEEIGETGDLAKLARAVAQLGRVTVRQREWSTAVQARLEKQKRAASETLSGVARAAGLSDQAYAQIRGALLAIDPFESKRAGESPHEN